MKNKVLLLLLMKNNLDKILLHKMMAAVKSHMKLKLELLHLVLLVVVKLKLVRLKQIVLVLTLIKTVRVLLREYELVH